MSKYELGSSHDNWTCQDVKMTRTEKGKRNFFDWWHDRPKWLRFAVFYGTMPLWIPIGLVFMYLPHCFWQWCIELWEDFDNDH